ncbi:cell division protease FtsH [Carboxydocella sporoproducens DSM 16521]|uniref:ATP-dependent zinc metalloprotease FtsH n=2 Tax=Carboxydocella TaxID=178898 RepID=A0A1T4RL94_9FIRM|nr:MULTISPECIES: ATP-dependent zinc metalloprotease FtsH [Carboxydocella]AVX19302.1 membrane protease FtsH catalytic subunit [Carboxydocella thermautotrophica]AVX29716.1 membrane protease FtsH catalytic subunit [Carboxydocella thermautotrophica]SKA16451.1 cell division protease FtsH [Carboxydocella sporoproducens DSM 16521]
MNKLFKGFSIYLLIGLLVFAILELSGRPSETVNRPSYDEFVKMVQAGKIREVTITTENLTNSIEGVDSSGKKFALYGPIQDERLIDRLMDANVKIVHNPPPKNSVWLSVLTSLLPVLLLVGVMFFFMQQAQGGGNRVMSFGKSRARLASEDRRRVTFADVAGADEAKEELQEVVEFLKYPKKFHELGARIPKGVLLFGPPGTGKTLLARAVAGEAGVPFYSISGSDFVEMFVGVGASRVRDLFEQAKKSAPCIVFIDEIDAVGRQRGAGLGGGHDEREQTLNQLLVEMDGFTMTESVIVIAATNRPDILDPALLRPGRFDRQIVVDRPDLVGRKEILKVHIRNKPIAPSVDLDVLARRTPGFTGADLANMVNEAALLAARANKKQIEMTELENAIERVIAGPEKKSKVISEQEKKLVSYHEAGHAVVGYLLPNTDPVHKVSIIPRGRAGGYTLLLPKEDRYYATRSQLLDQVTMLLAGRVAEALMLNEISTGAQNDLERATNTVRRMITEYGMSENLGPLTFGNRSDQVFLGRDIARDRNYSEEVAKAIDAEVRRMIEECYQRAESLLLEHKDKLELVANTLMEKETIEADEFTALMQKAENE